MQEDFPQEDWRTWSPRKSNPTLASAPRRVWAIRVLLGSIPNPMPSGKRIADANGVLYRDDNVPDDAGKKLAPIPHLRPAHDGQGLQGRNRRTEHLHLAGVRLDYDPVVAVAVPLDVRVVDVVLRGPFATGPAS